MTLPTKNPDWGFHGTIALHHSECTTALIWSLAFNHVRANTGCDDEAIRRFLDSTQGRHFADDVHQAIHFAHQDPATAVSSTCDRWMGWTISKRTSDDTGIPAGIPYLQGFVSLEELLMENE